MTTKQQLFVYLFVFAFVGVIYVGLRPFSPQAVDNDIYAVKFLPPEGYEKRYQLQGSAFDCQPQGSNIEVLCTTTFEGQPLTVAMTYQNETQRYAESCTMTYAGQPVACDPGWDYEHPSSSAIVRDDLGISAARFAELRQSNWWLYWPEGTWLRLSNYLAAGAGLLMMMLHWLWYRETAVSDPLPPFYRFLHSLLSGLVTWFVLVWGVNAAANIWLEPQDINHRLIPIVGWIGAIIAALWRWQILGGWQPQPKTAVRLLTSLAQGAMVFVALNFLLLIGLLFLGFVD